MVATAAVGTRNPVKIRATANALRRVWPAVECRGCDVESSVPEQPTGEEEAILGATNRAIRSCQLLGTDLGVGLEGYTVDTPTGMFLSAWVAIVHHEIHRGKIEQRQGNATHVGLGSGGRILLPESIAQRVRQGEELGPVMDLVTAQKNTKQKEGAVGILTNGLVGREEALMFGVLYALASFVSPIEYE